MPALPIHNPWKPNAMTAIKLANELIPWSEPNRRLRAFISVEAYPVNERLFRNS